MKWLIISAIAALIAWLSREVWLPVSLEVWGPWWNHFWALNDAEQASWVQAIGGILAIVATAILAGYGELSRRSQERRQAIIHYKIAGDIFRDITMSIEDAKSIANTVGPDACFNHVNAILSHKLPRNIEILQQIVMSPLPNSEAAKDVQVMRSLSLNVIEQIQILATKRPMPNPDDMRDAFELLLTNVRPHRDKQRCDTGPSRSWWPHWKHPAANAEGFCRMHD